MPGTKPELTYLFEADFSDGTTYHQGHEDTSLNYPPNENGDGKSAFTDVAERLGDVLRFRLVNVNDPDDKIEVDLATGLFTVRGLTVALHRFDLTAPLKLVYYRKVNFEQTLQREDGRVVERRHYVASYCLGWQMLGKDGKNHDCMLEFVPDRD